MGQPPKLTVGQTVQYKIIVPAHNYESPEHIKKVEKSLAGTKDSGNLFESLEKYSKRPTQVIIEEDMPSSNSSSHPAFPTKVIGRGSFGTVTYVYYLTNRIDFVEKQPNPHTQKYNESIWRREARITQMISHVRISSSLSFDFIFLIANS